jgi:hypothetical protein
MQLNPPPITLKKQPIMDIKTTTIIIKIPASKNLRYKTPPLLTLRSKN